MPDRLVILVQRGLQGPPRVTLEDPAEMDDAAVGVDVVPTDEEKKLLTQMKEGPWDPDVVERTGAFLCELLKRQPAIKKDFEDRLKPAIDTGPIYLRIEPPDLEDWPWEALNDPNEGFIALRRPWPIARVRRVPRSKPEYVFVPPLRIAAVMGASGDTAETQISARDEWRELLGAVKASKLNIEMKVFVAEDDLRADIERERPGWIKPPLPLSDDGELFDEIKAFRPHLLHFFCHGLAASPPFLQIASRVDWRNKKPGTITIEAMQLRDRADPEPGSNVWLITLNCCESAQQAAGGGSRSRAMANSLVMAGFPAVVGMRQRVESQLASRFCGLWYQTLLEDLRDRLAAAVNGGGAQEFHWACALFAARQGILKAVDNAPLQQSARRLAEWTIPVLYSRFPPFMIRVASGIQPILRSDPAPATPAPATPAPAAPAPAVTPVAAGPAAPAAVSLNDKLKLVDEMQQLVEARATLSAQTNIPEAVRKNVLQDIDARLAAIEQMIS